MRGLGECERIRNGNRRTEPGLTVAAAQRDATESEKSWQGNVKSVAVLIGPVTASIGLSLQENTHIVPGCSARAKYGSRYTW